MTTSIVSMIPATELLFNNKQTLSITEPQVTFKNTTLILSCYHEPVIYLADDTEDTPLEETLNFLMDGPWFS